MSWNTVDGGDLAGDVGEGRADTGDNNLAPQGRVGGNHEENNHVRERVVGPNTVGCDSAWAAGHLGESTLGMDSLREDEEGEVAATDRTAVARRYSAWNDRNPDPWACNRNRGCSLEGCHSHTAVEGQNGDLHKIVGLGRNGASFDVSPGLDWYDLPCQTKLILGTPKCARHTHTQPRLTDDVLGNFLDTVEPNGR